MTAGVFASLLGGIGLFMLGMWLMTEGLKLSAGGALQAVLESWTRSAPRGFLAGGVRDLAQLEPGDLRLNMPRFQGGHFEKNLALLDRFEVLAGEAGCTPAQLCLAWLLARDEIIVPIPGTTNPDHMRENAAAAGLRLSPDVLARVDELVNPETVAGPRYSEALQASIDTEG